MNIRLLEGGWVRGLATGLVCALALWGCGDDVGTGGTGATGGGGEAAGGEAQGVFFSAILFASTTIGR